jgi:hypothetical protein
VFLKAVVWGRMNVIPNFRVLTMTIDEVIAQFPKLTRTQHLARIREDQAMFDAYPGRYVAYIDNWEGETLNRTIVFVADGVEDYGKKFHELTAEVREKIDITLTPDPDEGFSCPSVMLG